MKLNLCFILVALICTSGCKGSPSATSTVANMGFELSMYVRDETGAESLYKVTRDGTLGFGGGLNARLDHTTWSGPLFPEELRQLHDLLAAADWFKAKPESTGQPEQKIYRISLNSKEKVRSFRLKGDHLQIKPIRDLLDTASLRRLEVDLRRLPEPNLPREMKTPTTAPEDQKPNAGVESK